MKVLTSSIFLLLKFCAWRLNIPFPSPPVVSSLPDLEGSGPIFAIGSIMLKREYISQKCAQIGLGKVLSIRNEKMFVDRSGLCCGCPWSSISHRCKECHHRTSSRSIRSSHIFRQHCELLVFWTINWSIFDF